MRYTSADHDPQSKALHYTMPLNPESRILNPYVFWWLLLCAVLVAAMVLIGGYTRLSGSGLSIVSWKPIHGVMPPLGEAEWQEEFAAYQQSPQYIKVNKGMSLDDFKTIFWPEFIHRLLGRIIGIVFFFPLVFFALRKSISARFGWRLAGIFALGGLQGLIGWLMVKSGLQNDPHVSHIRLALHLSVAFVILGLLVWEALSAKDQMPKGKWQKPGSFAICPLAFGIWFTLLCLQIVLGALLAGLHGGLLYNTWPDMDGEFIPAGLWSDNPALIQFLHRSVAVLVAVGFLFWWYLCRAYVKNNHLGKVCAWVTSVIAVQCVLGVLTLINAVPLPLALCHQMTGLVLFVSAVVLMHKIRAHDD